MIFYSKSKFRQISHKTNIPSYLPEILFMSQYLRVNINETNIIYLKYKFGYTGPKVKVSLNSHKHSHTRQFEYIKCNKLEMFIQYLTSRN